MATMKDVARLAGVSTATVSATINMSTYVSPALRARVEAAIRQLGYAPSAVARSLKMGVTRLLGLVVADITNPFFTELVHVVEQAAQLDGYSVLLVDTDQDVEKELAALRLMESQRVDGVILAPSGSPSDYRRAGLSAYRPPIVLVDRAVSQFDADVVVIDNVRAAHLATRHIVALGHRRIATIAGSAHVSTGADRLAGFRTALLEAGLPFDPALVRAGNFREDDGYEAATALLRLPSPPSAIFAANNQMLIGLIRAVVDLGLACPRDVSIAAVDDLPWAGAVSPRLTMIRQPVREMGETVVRLLLQRIAAPATAEPRHVVLQPELVVRDSCAPWPGLRAAG